MSGELTLSQFKSTTTQNNDLVIGNPVPYGSTDTADRYLVFQVTDKVGPTHNPHVRCEYTGSAWRIKLSDNGVTDSDFAFLNTGTDLVPQNFIGVNVFNGVTNFLGTVNTRTINLGNNISDIITFNGSSEFTGPITFNSPVTFQSDVTVMAPSYNVAITSASFASTANLLLNKGNNIGAGGLIGIEVADVDTPVGYVKTLADNTGWQVKAPAKSGTVTFVPSLGASDLVIKPVNGDFGTGHTRTFEFLNGSGYVGGYNVIPNGGKVVLSTPIGFVESPISATILGYLSNVTSDVQGQLTANNGVVFTLNSRVDTAESNLTIALATMATNQTTSTSLISALDSRVGAAEANISSSLSSFASSLAAETAARTSLTATVNGHTSAISAEATARASADAAEALARTTLASSIPGIADARIANALSTYSDSTKASAQSVTDLAATVSSNASTAHTELMAYVGPTGTVSSQVTTLSTTQNNHTTTIGQHTTSINGLEAEWGVDIVSDANGKHVSGVKLNSDSTGTSTFSVLADRFEIRDASNTASHLVPFYYSGGQVHLNSSVIFTSPGVAPGVTLSQWLTDANNANTTIINGGWIQTHTILANSIETDFAITNILRSSTYSPGTTAAAPVGFKLSGTPFGTTFIGDSSPTQVQMELGSEANFGGYKVGKVTDKVFASPAIAFYATTGATIQYPYAALNNPMPLFEQIRSGISVSQTTIGGTANPGHFRAQVDGIYTIDLACQVHGSGLSNSYMNVYVGVKRAANPSAGFAEVIFHDWNFFGSGKSEPHVSGTVATELLVNDEIGIFYDAPGMSYINVWLTICNTGPKAAADRLLITTPDMTMNAAGSTFPQTLSFVLSATNGFGNLTWGIDAAGGDGLAIDGTTTPQATIGTDGQTCSVYYASAPTYGVTKHIKLRVTDGKSSVDTKVLNFVFNSAAPIVITTPLNNTTWVQDGDPLEASVVLSATGGTGTYTWSVSNSGTLGVTTADITGNILLGYPSGSLTYQTCTIRCTSGGSYVDKVINVRCRIVAPPPPGGGGSCFVAGTLVLLADGTSKPIETVSVGDSVYAINVYKHQSGLSDVVSTQVTGTNFYPAIQPIVSVKEVLCTLKHPWGTTEPESGARLWAAADSITTKMMHKAVTCSSKNKIKVIDVAADAPVPAGNIDIVYSLATEDQSYFVSSTQSGPWYLVHNMSIQNLMY